MSLRRVLDRDLVCSCSCLLCLSCSSWSSWSSWSSCSSSLAGAGILEPSVSPETLRICSGDGKRRALESSRGRLKDALSGNGKHSCFSLSLPEINGSSSISHAIESSIIRVRLPTNSLGLSSRDESGESESQNDISAGDVSPVLESKPDPGAATTDGKTAVHAVKPSSAACKKASFLLEKLCAARPSASYAMAL